MAKLKVSTDRVYQTSTRIKSINDSIRNDFNRVQTEISQLHNAWGGGAANNSSGKFGVISSELEKNRYQVMDGYVNFLRQQVSETYSSLESSLDTLASRFK